MKSSKNKRLINKRNPRRNRQIIGGAFLFAVVGIFLLFIFRFSYIVANGKIDDQNLTKKAEALYQDDSVLKANRGTIFDAMGNPIAEDSTSYSIYAVIDHRYTGSNDKKLYVTNKNKVATVLSQYLPMSKKDILKTLNPQNKKTFQVEFGTAGQGLSLAIKQEIENHNLRGVYFTETPARLYPNGTFASHQIGLAQQSTTTKAGSSTTALTGVMGIEKSYNKILSGTNGVKQVKKDSYGYQLPNTKVKQKAAKNGSDVYLTIDSRLQSYLETLLTKAQTKYDAKGFNAILMNPKTGQILAASQRPTFNPQTGASLGSFWRDTLTEDAYEPGSVMKVFTLASIIDAGKYPPNSYYTSGQVQVGGSTIHDWNTTGWGSIPYSQAFPRSSNVGFVHLEQILGEKEWLEYIKKFKFLQSTNSGLSGESSGSIQFKSASDQAITSFGQGINVTAMQMMQGYSAIANNGKEMKPQIIDKVVNPATGKTTKYKPVTVGHPVKKSTTKQVLQDMQDVVYKNYGTGAVYKIPGYRIAAKTGTAQISAGNGGGYLTGDNNYIFSVVGMAPAKNPQYVLYITMKQPQNMTESPEKILSEIFNPMMKRALEYNQGKTTKTDQATMPKVSGETVSTSVSALTKAQLKLVQIGTGNTVVQQLPQAGEKVLSNQHVFVMTNGAMTMPDMTGWSKSDVLKFAEITGKSVKISGTGYVTKQDLAAKSLLDSTKEITVTLQP
ncbi:penicillin-binding protein [Loigolactobacillus iwatensis]|uniref:penicillin-binding protein n=1 Tax=Loigolactobacillus iwatensis TaxID=1267156 RepID=UPI000F7F6BE9|nr:penicillin-binding protein [Loigolactobacillus iwatensis]